MFIQYGLQLGPAKPKLTVLMPTLHLLDNTKMDKGLFAIPNNKSRWGNLQWGEVWKERNTAETETNINQDLSGQHQIYLFIPTRNALLSNTFKFTIVVKSIIFNFFQESSVT